MKSEIQSKTKCPKCKEAELTFETYWPHNVLAACPGCGLKVMLPGARLYMNTAQRMAYVTKSCARLRPEKRKVKS